MGFSSRASAYASWDAARAITAPWLTNTHIGTIQRLAPGEILYAQGEHHDCFYLVRSGFIHTTVLRSSGSYLLLEIFGPGAIFGGHRHSSTGRGTSRPRRSQKPW